VFPEQFKKLSNACISKRVDTRLLIILHHHHVSMIDEIGYALV